MTITIKGNISPMGLGFNTIILPPIWLLGSNPPTVFPLPDATQGSAYNSGQIKADPTTTFSENAGFNTKLSDLGLSLTFTKSTSNGPGNSTPGYYVISGTPTITNDTPYEITIVANNSGKTNSKNFSLLINPAIPVWTTDSIPEAYETLLYNSDKMNATYAQSFLQVVNTGDTDLTTIGLTITNNIGYCSIDGTPTTTGTYNVTVRATNHGQNAEKSFSLVIDYANPLWTTDTLPNITEGSLYSSGNVIARSSQSYSEISGGTSLSSLGLTLNDHTTYCEIVGTSLITGGPYNINLRATNHGKNADKTFIININPAAPIWTTNSITPAAHGQIYTSNHLNALYAPSFSSITDLSTLGLTLTSHAGYCVLTGPNTMAIGSYPITLRATNGTQHTDKQFTFTVDNGAPVWITTSITNPIKGTKYNSGHINATYANSFSQTDGDDLNSLGLTLNSYSGYCEIVGTPKTTGNYSVTLTATNNTASINHIFDFTIEPSSNLFQNNTVYVHFDEGDDNADGYTVNTSVKSIKQASIILNNNSFISMNDSRVYKTENPTPPTLNIGSTYVTMDSNAYHLDKSFSYTISISQSQYTISGTSLTDVWDGCIIPKYSEMSDEVAIVDQAAINANKTSIYLGTYMIDITVDFNNSFIDANGLSNKYLFGTFGNIGTCASNGVHNIGEIEQLANFNRWLTYKMTLKNLNLWTNDTIIPFINEFVGDDGNFIGTYKIIKGNNQISLNDSNHNIPHKYNVDDNTRYYVNTLHTKFKDHIIATHGTEPADDEILEAQNYGFWFNTNAAMSDDNATPNNNLCTPTYPSGPILACSNIMCVDNCFIGGSYTYLSSLNSWNCGLGGGTSRQSITYKRPCVNGNPGSDIHWGLASGIYYKNTSITITKSTGWGGQSGFAITSPYAVLSYSPSGPSYNSNCTQVTSYAMSFSPAEWTLPLHNTIDTTLTDRSTFITKINKNGTYNYS